MLNSIVEISEIKNINQYNFMKIVSLNIILASAYLVFGSLSFAASVEYGNVTSVLFAPEGIALAFFILFGPRVAFGVILGQMILSYYSGPSILGGLGIGIFNALEGILGGYLFHRLKLSKSFDRPKDVIVFISIVFFILQPISATFGVLILFAVSSIPAETFGWFGQFWLEHGIQKPLASLDLVANAWISWWIGNSLGQLIFAPLVLAWVCTQKRFTKPSLFDLAIFIASIIFFYYIFQLDLEKGSILILVFSYPLVLWIGRLGIKSITTMNLLISLVIVYIASTGYAFMENLSASDRVFYASLAISSLSLSSLFIYSLLSERNIFINQLQELANKDPLTQADNRRYFMEQAELMIKVANRHKDDIDLCMIDIDFFKSINDSYGHEAGDIVLKKFVENSSHIIREYDLFGRFGGEEFVILFSRANDNVSSKIIARMQTYFKENPIFIDEEIKINLTFSAGIAKMKEGESLRDLIKRADISMYEAKQTGRDTVIISK